MKKTGQRLKEARESRGISLQEVSVHLKISNRILRALEEGDSAQLPAKTFLRGFVQSYAQLLRLDSAEILELFQAEMGTTHPKMITKFIDAPGAVEEGKTNISVSSSVVPATTAVTSSDRLTSQSSESKENVVPSMTVSAPMAPAAPSISVDHKTWSRSKQIGTGLVIIIIAGIILGVVRVIEKYEREAQVVEAPPVELPAVPRSDGKPATVAPPTMGEEPTALTTEQIDALASDSSDSTIQAPVDKTTVDQKKSDKATGVSAETTPKTNTTSTPSPAPSATPASSTAAGTANSKTEPAPKSATNEVSEPATPKKPEAGRTQEVIVEALDRIIVEYSIDDKAKATIVLSPEKVHTFRGDKKLQLSFSDGGSVNIIYNGKDKGVPGNLGKPLQMNFPE